jgi:hypothetical protein
VLAALRDHPHVDTDTVITLVRTDHSAVSTAGSAEPSETSDVAQPVENGPRSSPLPPSNP